MTLALGLLAAAQVAVVSGQTPGASADQSVLSKFLDSTEPLTQYRAVQRLEARNQRFKKHGWVRIEGRLAASPSFWTRRVDIVRRYGRVGGVRVPLGVESVAQVRIAGLSELTMTYQYEMVNGQPVDAGDARLAQ